MSGVSVRLFGKLSVRWNDRSVNGLNGAKVQELFCYLLLHRDRPHCREALASLLWGDAPTAQSKKYFRQALWQLQMALKCQMKPSTTRTLLIDSDWVQLNTASGLWLDVACFERACAAARGVSTEHLDAETVASMEKAVDLYQGDLLEGWYQDWCLYERDRLQGLYLTMLDKLIGCCEAQGRFEAGMHYATLSLRYDRARECTHQRLMRLYDLAGDRAGALRQYDRCLISLDEELGVKPADMTVALYQQISAGQLRATAPAPADTGGSEPATLAAVLGRLRHIEVTLGGIQEQLHTDIQTVQAALQRETLAGIERRASVRSVPAVRDPGRQKPAARG